MTVTDEPTPPAPADLYAAVAAFSGQLADLRRLVLAGGRAGVEPAAIPSTGLLPDVTDGALIESAWGVAVGGSTGRVIHRFDNLAQLTSQWSTAPTGAAALMLDTMRRYTKRAAGWQPDVAGGLVTATANASGFPPITTHDLGRVPIAVLLSAATSTNYVYALNAAPSSGSFQVHVRVANTGTAVNAAAVSFYWMVY